MATVVWVNGPSPKNLSPAISAIYEERHRHIHQGRAKMVGTASIEVHIAHRSWGHDQMTRIFFPQYATLLVLR